MHEKSELDLRVEDDGGAVADLFCVVGARSLGSTGEPAVRRRGMVTGLSVLVLSTGPSAVGQVDSVLRWAPPELRVELVLADAQAELIGRLDRLAWPWSTVRSDGIASSPDRAALLDAATADAGGEFVVVMDPGSDGRSDRLLRHLGDALELMWVNGADVTVVGVDADLAEAGPSTAAVTPDPDGRERQLAAGLGLRRGLGAVVVLRRWVARFLFDELGRSIDPAEELAERVRLLELRMIAVVDDAP